MYNVKLCQQKVLLSKRALGQNRTNVWIQCKFMLVTLSLPRVINFNFLFQSLNRDMSYSMENLAIDSLLR